VAVKDFFYFVFLFPLNDNGFQVWYDLVRKGVIADRLQVSL
jgi:hypothetical protein